MADITDIPEELAATLGFVQELRRRLEEEATSKPGFNSKFQKPLADLTIALKSLSTEARQWTSETAERCAVATPEQKSDAAIAWLSSLPVGARMEAYRSLAMAESTNFDKLPLSYGG